MQTTEKPLTEQAPSEIDRQLSAIYVQRIVLGNLILNEGRRIEITEDSITSDEAAGRTEHLVANNFRIAGFRASIANLELQRAALVIQEEPLEAEFERRGGWTRAFIVDGGHVHSSRHCSSCFETTRFTWLTDLSNLIEDEIIDRAGERACTVCYPTAPIDVLAQASKLLSTEEKAQLKARRQREAREAAREGKPVDRKISHPHGDVVVDFLGRPAKTENAAIAAAVNAVYDSHARPAQNSAWNRPAYVGSAEEARNFEIVRIAVEALAHKHGTDQQTQLDIISEKALAKFIRLNANSLEGRLLALEHAELKLKIKLARG